MQSRYVRETVADRHCLFLIVNGQRHLIATSRVVDSGTFGPKLQSDVQSVNSPAVGPIAPAAPSRPKRVRITLVNLRRSVDAARRRCELPLVFPPVKSRGHLAFHDGREYARIGVQVHSGPIGAPLGTNGYRRGLRYFGSPSAWRLWAMRNGVRVARGANSPAVAKH